MTRSPNKLIPTGFRTVPGLEALDAVVVTAGPPSADVRALGVGVTSDGEVPPELGFDRAALADAGFEAKAGSVLVLPQAAGPQLVAVGLGPSEQLTVAVLRDAAAVFARAVSSCAELALRLDATGAVSASDAVRALAEGALLGRYRYTELTATSKHVPLEALSLEVPGAGTAEQAIAEATVSARAAIVARDLANTPPGHLTATDLGDIAVALGERFGFAVELFDKQALIELGCGGLLGVNQGSTEEPRMIRLEYAPDGAKRHLGLVGKGIMYDSGGISLKPSDPMHLLMKMDMGGAAAVLGAFAGLRDAGVDARVIGWLMCTDNMPSGTAYKLGDVLTARGGTTVEVKNTDAEGRLVMMDALVLANEAAVDAIIDIATLTGAALVALGPATAPVLGNDQGTIDLVRTAATVVDEPVWQLPLEKKYRPQLDSTIADIANLGGPFAGATTAALFLAHFVGNTPWAHLDIAGTMQTEKDDSWRSAGATGFGARILLETARTFTVEKAESVARSTTDR
ncbi:leucyl aminopeptidase [Leucobacter sp. OLJS4]|nr:MULTISPECIES: leucyl aminopeptidase [unclassified Leucobacter]PIJ10736.1 leucyl aminopeptidase [Leucobacter sp. OLJS4]PIJ53523.1 leucyl aminopeptidase [Leucobacter sp. OAMSW11]PIJ53586.1 leucyl aminopeptidase [Leucobacter sp. OLES1]PII82301.1 leucyl aminopeptidase [Leucobacter sp. OLCALW19]PII87518.1 leucyl aminopeptidase [Leucobacter sp. OLTLW20]